MKHLSVSLVLLSAIVLSACNKQESTTTEVTPAAQEQPAAAQAPAKTATPASQEQPTDAASTSAEVVVEQAVAPAPAETAAAFVIPHESEQICRSGETLHVRYNEDYSQVDIENGKYVLALRIEEDREDRIYENDQFMWIQDPQEKSGFLFEKKEDSDEIIQRNCTPKAE